MDILKTFLCAFIVVVIASDGEWFPIPNVIALCVLVIFIILNRIWGKGKCETNEQKEPFEDVEYY